MKTLGLPVVLGLLALPFAASAANHAFDLRPQTPGARRILSASARATDGLVRATALARGSTYAAPLAVGDRLAFDLFDGVSTTLTLVERTPSPLGGATFLATADGASERTACVLQTDDGLSVTLDRPSDGRTYAIVADGRGVTVRELDPAAGTVNPCQTVYPEKLPAATDGTARAAVPRLAAAADQPDTLIDMLVAFDRAAVTWANQNGGGITNFANLAVQRMNEALSNSGLGSAYRYRLVSAFAVDAEGGSSLGDALNDAYEGNGAWAAVHAERNRVGADIVSVLVDTGSAYGTTGIGFSLRNADHAAFSENAYNACAVRAVANSHTMTHEVGHNLGAGHSNIQAQSPGPQLFSYSSGYHFYAGGKPYHTIMAYNNDGHADSPSYASAPFFSSPDITFEGVAGGTASNDNVRTIRQTYKSAAAWRKQVIPMSYDVSFSPAGGSTFTDSIAVTLTPGKAGTEIRYTLDGSTPTLGSALYTAPIVLTQTTTIRAVTVVDGVPGPIFEATYALSDLGTGVDAPQLAWRTSEGNPWLFQTTTTFDGVDAVQSGTNAASSWLETTVTGPTDMSFYFKRAYLYFSAFSVTCDDQTLFTFDENGYPNDWQQAEVRIPTGTHAVRFAFTRRGAYSGVFNGVYLDKIRFDALSRPPTIDPASTVDESTARTFTGEMAVTLTPPAGRTGSLLYTTDGSDPAGETGQTYAGPIALTQSTLVRATFVEGGRDPSTEAKGLYLERHPVRPGEWTTDVSGAQLTATTNVGVRLIALLKADYATDSSSRAFHSVAHDPAFLAWAELNGICLVTADTTRHCDAQTARTWFEEVSTQYGLGIYNVATLYLTDPQDPMTLLGVGLLVSGQTLGSVTYDGTVSTLIAGIASVLGQTLPAAPASSAPTLVSAFPVTVTLTNPNATGTLYYTLDGSAPTPRNGTPYAGPITIASAGSVLKAAVLGASGISSPVLVQAFRTFAEALGTTGIDWSSGGAAPWVLSAENPPTVAAPYLGKTAYTSWIQGVVQGPGILTYTLYDVSNSSNNRIAVTRNGAEEFSRGYDGNFESRVTRTINVADAGPTTFRWTLAVLNGNYHFSACGAWLSSVQWTPAADVPVAGKSVLLPHTWFATHFPQAPSSGYADLSGLDSDGDGFTNAEEYILGTDPNSEDSALSVVIRMVDGQPVVEWTSTNEAIGRLGFEYRLKGRETLSGPGWEWPTNAAHRLFRLFVEPK